MNPALPKALTFHGDAVWLGTVLAGRIEQVESRPRPWWAYIPVREQPVPYAFQKPIYDRTKRGVIASLRLALRREHAKASS